MPAPPPRRLPRLCFADLAAIVLPLSLLFLLPAAVFAEHPPGTDSSSSGHPFPPGSSSAQLYKEHCSRCHGADAAARRPPARLKTRPFDFRRCDVASAEPLAEWITAIRDGGASVGRSPEMPAFKDKLQPGEIQGLAESLRGLCTASGWPNGELNFPRPLIVEKAFPEDEVVLGTSLAHGPGDERQLRLDATIEKRLGKRSMVEVSVPGATTWGADRRRSDPGDVSLAVKHVLLADRDGSHILSAGLEVTLPTAPQASALAHDATLYEPFVAAGLRRGPVYLQAALALELPSRRPWGDRELGYGVYLGRDLSASASRWTLGVEFTGENRALALTPQVRKGLTSTGALAAGFGLRVPLNERHEEPLGGLVYLVWDFREPLRARRPE